MMHPLMTKTSPKRVHRINKPYSSNSRSVQPAPYTRKLVKMVKKLQTQKKSVVDVVNLDDLAVFQDSELDSRASYLYDEMRRRGIPQASAGAVPYETELAYVQREQQIRMKRRTAHRAYLNSHDDGYVDESSLPEFRAVPPPWYWQN